MLLEDIQLPTVHDCDVWGTIEPSEGGEAGGRGTVYFTHLGGSNMQLKGRTPVLRHPSSL